MAAFFGALPLNTLLCSVRANDSTTDRGWSTVFGKRCLTGETTFGAGLFGHADRRTTEARKEDGGDLPPRRVCTCMHVGRDIQPRKTTTRERAAHRWRPAPIITAITRCRSRPRSPRLPSPRPLPSCSSWGSAARGGYSAGRRRPSLRGPRARS